MHSIKSAITSPLLKGVEPNDIKPPELAVRANDGMKSYEKETGKSFPYISYFVISEIEIFFSSFHPTKSRRIEKYG